MMKWRTHEGFGTSLYSHSQLAAVIRCLRNQERPHRRKTLREEYPDSVRKFNVVGRETVAELPAPGEPKWL
jgi:hypothetical protein